MGMDVVARLAQTLCVRVPRVRAEKQISPTHEIIRCLPSLSATTRVIVPHCAHHLQTSVLNGLQDIFARRLLWVAAVACVTSTCTGAPAVDWVYDWWKGSESLPPGHPRAPCSNTGVVQPDTAPLFADQVGTVRCECFPCYTGPTCAVLNESSCEEIDASVGTEIMAESVKSHSPRRMPLARVACQRMCHPEIVSLRHCIAFSFPILHHLSSCSYFVTSRRLMHSTLINRGDTSLPVGISNISL